MSFKNDLIKSIPLFQQNSVALQQYIETSGEVFDEMVDAVDNFKTYSDYAHVDIDHLDDFSSLFDLKFFANLDEYARRKFAKDAAKLYKKLGTAQAIRYIFKIIGIVVEVEEMWMMAPIPDINDALYLYNGSLSYHEADVGAYYKETGTIAPIAPLQFINGKEKIYDSGSYVDLYFGSDYYRKWRIYGEEYNEYVNTEKFFMIKVPYYNLNILEESYNLYGDGDGDGALDYIDQEKISLAKELVDYTLGEYIGANEVILQTQLVDINEDTLLLSDMNDNDFDFSVINKDSNENRIAAYTVPSEEIFGAVNIFGYTIVPSIDSEEIFGDIILQSDITIPVDSINSLEAFENHNIYNNILWVNGLIGIDTEEVVGTPALPTLLTLSEIPSESAFGEITVVIEQFVDTDSISSDESIITPVNAIGYTIQPVDVTSVAVDGVVSDDNVVMFANDQAIVEIEGIPSAEIFEFDTIMST